MSTEGRRLGTDLPRFQETLWVCPPGFSHSHPNDELCNSTDFRTDGVWLPDSEYQRLLSRKSQQPAWSDHQPMNPSILAWHPYPLLATHVLVQDPILGQFRPLSVIRIEEANFNVRERRECLECEWRRKGRSGGGVTFGITAATSQCNGNTKSAGQLKWAAALPVASGTFHAYLTKRVASISSSPLTLQRKYFRLQKF